MEIYPRNRDLRWVFGVEFGSGPACFVNLRPGTRVIMGWRSAVRRANILRSARQERGYDDRGSIQPGTEYGGFRSAELLHVLCRRNCSKGPH